MTLWVHQWVTCLGHASLTPSERDRALIEVQTSSSTEL